MNMKTPIAALALTVYAASFGSAAQAANYVEISGANADFFYDADFWGAAPVTVTGDSISFGIAGDYSTAASVKTSPNKYVNDSTTDETNPSVYIVARAGYTLAGDVTHTSAGTYSLTANGGQANIESAIFLYAGQIVDGSYNTSGDPLKFSDNSAQEGSNGSIRAGAYTITNTSVYLPPHGPYSVLGIDTTLISQAQQTGAGSTTSVFTSETYGFHVSAVPEPETYGMLLAGLGLVGFVARRRKGAVAA